MRNLVVLNRGHVIPESRTYPDLTLIDTVFDPVSDSVTFVLSSIESCLIEVQQFMKNGEINVLASFSIQDPISESRLLSFNHFVDTNQLILVFQNGDIITATYDINEPHYETTVVEIVGSIDIGLTAAQWSPDDENLSILTAENKLILLSRSFEPICEKELSSNDIKISDSKHVSVGWGKKETQFKGKGARALERERDILKHGGLDLKEETLLRDPTVAEIERGALSPFDSNQLKISWRGDAEFFSVTTVETVLVEDTAEIYDRRVIRVFTREGELESVNEAVDGLEHNLSWKPQGSLIASTQRHVEDGEEVLDLVFYEKNGLRHGQYNTRLDPSFEVIHKLEWSCDSEVILFQLSDRVQLWTTKNYHWYLKQELFASDIVFAKFHPEKPLNLMIGTTTGLEIVDLTYKIVTGPTHLGMDQGMTLVTDGSTIKITPLSIANVPPPISFRELEVYNNVNDLAVSRGNDIYAAITSDNNISLGVLLIDDMKKGKHPKLFGKIDSELIISNDNEFAKQVAFIKDSHIVVAVDGPSYSKIFIFSIQDEPILEECIDTPHKVLLMKSQANFDAVAVQTIDGSIYQLNESKELVKIGKFPQICRDFELASTEDEVTPFGISTNGKLFTNDRQIASGVTSLKTTDSHLLFTTVHSKLCFVHLKSEIGEFDYEVYQSAAATNDSMLDERIRDVERGSILVNAMPSKYSVVLEAPRGNLETICPRIMVVSGVRKFIKLTQYREAFIACRTHRIDLDILHDYDPELFFANIELFIQQLKKVEYLDLFVSCLHEDDITLTKYRETINDTKVDTTRIREDIQNLLIAPQEQVAPESLRKIIKNSEDASKVVGSKINRICKGILTVLLQPEYFERYLQTVITAYACEKPPNLTEALRLVGSFDNADQLEQAVTHLCFLQDINKLYDTALGVYDVKLALSIAQQSQKDPKEYLPFLQNLYVQPELRKKFLIDDFLKLHEKALSWLHEIGTEAHEEFDEYVVKHNLYKSALTIYKHDETRVNHIYAKYAIVLHNDHSYSEAGLTYEYLEDWESALQSYIAGKNWREAITILQKAEYNDQLKSSAEQLVLSLIDDHKYSDAAEIEFYFLHNIEEAIRLYCKNYKFDDAILLALKEKRVELIETVVDYQLNQGFGTIAELLADCKGQMASQLRRLRELREKKKEDPYSFYGAADDMDTPDNVSVAASETSTTPSFFTRYTGKTSGTAKTGVSRKSSKNRKREERKKAKGRKGTIYEEEYLIKSVGRLLERLESTEVDGVRLIEGLVRRHMKLQAYEIQKNWVELIDFATENIVEIHDMSERDRERIDDNGEVYLIEEIPIPVIRQFPRKAILDY